MTDDPSHRSHFVATSAAKLIINGCLQGGLEWKDILVTLETVISIVVACDANVNAPDNRKRYAQEIIDVLTQQAHLRVQEVLK